LFVVLAEGIGEVKAEVTHAVEDDFHIKTDADTAMSFQHSGSGKCQIIRHYDR